MDGVELDEKPKEIPWTIVILDREYIVKAIIVNEAKNLAALKYNEEMGTNYPLTFLKATARVRRHEDKRVKFHFGSGTPSILEVEEELRRLSTEEVAMSEKPDQRIEPTKW